MSRPKTIELLWLLDGKMDEAMAANLYKKLDKSEEARAYFDRLSNYYNGKTGVIIQEEDASSLSDFQLVKMLRLENDASEDQRIEDHLDKSKTCLKRLIKFHQNPELQDEVLAQAEVNERKALGDVAGTSNVYGDKMDNISWWTGPGIDFLGVRLSTAKLAVLMGLLVFSAIGGFYYFTTFFDDDFANRKRKGKIATNHQKKKGKKTGPNSNLKVEGKFDSWGTNFSSLLIRGNFVRDRRKKKSLIEPGPFQLIPGDKVTVGQTHQAVLGLEAGNLLIGGNSQIQLAHREQNVEVRLNWGSLMWNAYSRKKNLQVTLNFNKQKYMIYSTGQLLVEKDTDEVRVYSLAGKCYVIEQVRNAKYPVQRGQWLRIPAKDHIIPAVFIEELPDIYYRFFIHRERVFYDDFSKPKMVLPSGKSKSTTKVVVENNSRFLQVVCPVAIDGATVKSPKIRVTPGQALRLTWRYRLEGEPTNPKLAVVGKLKNGRAFYQATDLRPTREWVQEKVQFFLPAHLSLRHPFYLRLEFLGKAKVDLAEVELSRLIPQRTLLDRIDLNDPRSLDNMEIKSGIFRIENQVLQAKSTLDEGLMIMPKIKQEYFALEFAPRLNLPFCIVLNFRNLENYYGLKFSPQKQSVELIHMDQGAQQVLKKIDLVDTLPWSLKIIKRGRFICLQTDGKNILEHLLPKYKTGGLPGILIYPETKQEFKKLTIYQN